MSRTTRKKQWDGSIVVTAEVPMRGRRRRKDAPNSVQFLATIEGTELPEGRIRGANGMKWTVA